MDKERGSREREWIRKEVAERERMEKERGSRERERGRENG